MGSVPVAAMAFNTRATTPVPSALELTNLSSKSARVNVPKLVLAILI